MNIDHSKNIPHVTLYALQTCGHCRDAKTFLKKHAVAFRTVYIDLLVGEERNQALRRLKDVNPACSFPTITVDRKVIVGFKEENLRRALGLPSES